MIPASAMSGMLDLSLIASTRTLGAERLTALTAHYAHLKRYPMYLLWCDNFTAAFYTNPPQDRDLLQVTNDLLGFLQGNQRLVTLSPAGKVPALFPEVVLPSATDLGSLWLEQVGSALCDAAWAEAGLGFLTCVRAELAGRQMVNVTNATVIGALLDKLSLLRDSGDWAAFVRMYLRPDLSGRRVAVLGGRRDQFERASQALKDGYNLAECRWLPPAYIETRTKKQTIERLQLMDMVVVCTNRITHADTDHLRVADLPCERQDVHDDSQNAILKTVLDHFRSKGAMA